MRNDCDSHWHDYFFRRRDLHVRRRDAVATFGETPTSDGGTPSLHSAGRKRDTRYASLYQPRKVKSTAKDTRQAWGIYSDFFINLVNQEVPKLIKAGINVIVIAHAADMINEKTLSMEVVVPVKGSIRTKGVEAFFNDIVACKRLPVTELESYESDLLHITDKERQKKLKYVIQTQVTADTVCERLRGPEDMWEEKETFIDSNIQAVLDRMDQFYGE